MVWPFSTYIPQFAKLIPSTGYTQSGPLFHAKTRALEKALHKAFPPAPTTAASSSSKPKSLPPGTLPSHPGGVQLIYPSGPRKLRAADIPGFTPSATSIGDAEPDVPDIRGWWQRNDRTGEYEGMEDGFLTIADAIREVGGIDGVIGFSQGGAAAPMVAALLEPGRPEAFAEDEKKGGMAYPESFDELRKEQPPLKFAVAYSAFLAPNERYKAFYEPKIGTPVLHVVGTLDSVVEESRSLALVKACLEPKVAYHPGGHFVPIGKEMVGTLVGFIRQCFDDDEADENIEKMDVPF
jgi:hypothetical protein